MVRNVQFQYLSCSFGTYIFDKKTFSEGCRYAAVLEYCITDNVGFARTRCCAAVPKSSLLEN